jgi:hypothetical protein
METSNEISSEGLGTLTLNLGHWPTMVAITFLACMGLPVQAASQQSSIALEAGVIEYDAGGDQTYPLYTLRAGREVLPWLRLGLGMSLGSIGDIPRGPAFISGGSETLWRAFATGTAVTHRPFRKGGVPLLDRLSPEAGIGIGVVHSDGLEVDPAAFSNPFIAVEDQPTGLAVGLSLGIGIEASTAVVLRGTAWYWSDHLWGDALNDFELTGGIQVRW